MSHYLSQIAFHPRHREDHRLANVLLSTPYLQHQKLWELFERPPGSDQPFLFRQSDRDDFPQFLVLSEGVPKARDGCWRIQTKPFAPALSEGQVLAFSARLNPTRSLRQPGTERGKRQDLVMAALHNVASADRAAERQRLINVELPNWLAKRGERAGFSMVEQAGGILCAVTRYQTLRFQTSAASDNRKVTLGCADFVGHLRVDAPELFAQTLRQGLGHGRSFGLGLMLVKRAH